MEQSECLENISGDRDLTSWLGVWLLGEGERCTDYDVPVPETAQPSPLPASQAGVRGEVRSM